RQERAQPRIGEREAPVHISFARVQLRIEEELAIKARIRETHVRARPRLHAAEHMRLALRVDDIERADLHERGKHVGQWEHGTPAVACASLYCPDLGPRTVVSPLAKAPHRDVSTCA